MELYIVIGVWLLHALVHSKYSIFTSTEVKHTIGDIVATYWNVVVVYPIVEESIFRFCLPWWIENIYVLNIFFSLIHLGNIRMDGVVVVLGQCIFAYFLGLYLSNYNFDYISILYHSFFNLISTTIILGMTYIRGKLIIVSKNIIPTDKRWIRYSSIRRCMSLDDFSNISPKLHKSQKEMMIDTKDMSIAINNQSFDKFYECGRRVYIPK